MQDFVRFERLKKVAENLWNSAKSKFAKLDENNDFTGSNTFTEAFLVGKDIYVGGNPTYADKAGGTKKTGRRDVSSHANGNSGYVSSLLVRLSNNMGAGTNATASVWEVTKGSNIAGDIVGVQLHNNKTFTVYDDATLGKYIEIPIEKKYNDDTYFIYQITPSTDMAFTRPNSNNIDTADTVYLGDSDAVDTPTLQAHNNTNNAVGISWLVGDKINIREALRNLTPTNNDYVSKTKENIIYGKTVLNNGYINGKIYSLNNPGAVHIMNNSSMYSAKQMVITANTKLTTVVMGVDDALSIGDTVTNVKVGVADTNNRVEEYMIKDGTAKVHQAPADLGCSKAITVEINKSWTDGDKTLIVGAKGLKWGGRTSNDIGGNTYAGALVAVGQTISYVDNPGNRYVGYLIMNGEEMSLNDLARDVQSSARLNSAGKLDLNVMPELALNDFHTVASQQEAMDMITAGTLKSGDVVIVQDTSNSLHMYNGTTGGNFSNSFNDITVTSGGANSVNGIAHVNGNITLDGTNIQATMGGNRKHIQQHLVDLSTRANNNSSAITSSNNRITALERNRHRHTIGEMVTAFNKPSNLGSHGEFTVDGAVYIYCGTPTPYTLISSSTYPELARALGKGSVATFYVPHVPDIQHQPTNSTRYHFICAKVS